MFGVNGGEFLIIVIIAMIVVGPERLPEYAQRLREFVVRGRTYVKQGQESLTQELGSDIDWTKLDPRQYDPRTIVREALLDDGPAPTAAPTRASAAVVRPPAAGERAPFDADAT
ncbi:MAG: Sec-independent protein translocase TatB [Actinobacteria bacterium HGW-Actinobacteria-4]|nr:MAG: Sec-independent protein translocase TatB [Actinobacteria bacterium HGW-Actinobacteria-4]